MKPVNYDYMLVQQSKYYIAVLLIAASVSCIDNGHTYPPVEVAPLAEIAGEARQLPPDDHAEYVESKVERFENEYNAMIKVLGLDNTDNPASRWISSAATTVFSPAVDSLGAKTENVANTLGQIIGQADDIGLNIRQKGYATVVWGKPQSIIFCDSIMLIALNHYLGENYDGYSSMDAYKRAVKTPKMLPYDIAEALVATNYQYERPDNQKAIHRLVYEGIITEAKMQLVPNATLSDALGYTDEQLRWLTDNEHYIWDKLVSSKIIFDASETTADRLVMPSPSCPLISAEAPGRAGRYIGHRIVKAYLQANKSATLSSLLQGELYREANPLKNANYTPD